MEQVGQFCDPFRVGLLPGGLVLADVAVSFDLVAPYGAVGAG